MGLVRGMARTAVIAGTATAVSNRVSRRQARRWNEQAMAEQGPPVQQAPPAYYQPEPAPAAPPPPPPPPPPPAEDLTTQLQKLAALHQQGVLSDAEFAAAKAQLLGA
jgi:hypothetical protein